MEVDRAGRFEVGWLEIQADTFVEGGSKTSTSQHFQDPTGKGDEEKERQDRPVDEDGEEWFHVSG